MPPNARRKSPKSPAPPIDLEEIEHDPGFRGMLSFLEVSPAERAAMLAKRTEAESQSAVGQPPTAEQAEPTAPAGVTPLGELPAADRTWDQIPVDEGPATVPGSKPVGNSPVGGVPYMDVEGRGKRPLRFCQSVQDGHTATEHLAYQAIWNHARKHGRAEETGSIVVDIGLSQMRALLATDHKNVKRLVGSLREKLALDVVRQPDYRLALATRYRVYDEAAILERRRAAGLVWVVRTRTTRFVDLATVNRLLAGEPVGDTPMGDSEKQPMGELPFPERLAAGLREWADGDAARRIWEVCRRGSPDCTEDEALWFCRSKEPLMRSGRIEDPAELLIRSARQFFAQGGGAALADYRKQQAREQERERKRQRQMALMVLDDPESSEAELTWARETLAQS